MVIYGSALVVAITDRNFVGTNCKFRTPLTKLQKILRRANSLFPYAPSRSGDGDASLFGTFSLNNSFFCLAPTYLSARRLSSAIQKIMHSSPFT